MFNRGAVLKPEIAALASRGVILHSFFLKLKTNKLRSGSTSPVD